MQVAEARFVWLIRLMPLHRIENGLGYFRKVSLHRPSKLLWSVKQWVIGRSIPRTPMYPINVSCSPIENTLAVLE